MFRRGIEILILNFNYELAPTEIFSTLEYKLAKNDIFSVESFVNGRVIKMSNVDLNFKNSEGNSQLLMFKEIQRKMRPADIDITFARMFVIDFDDTFYDLYLQLIYRFSNNKAHQTNGTIILRNNTSYTRLLPTAYQ